jgi:hypothetical protein
VYFASTSNTELTKETAMTTSSAALQRYLQALSQGYEVLAEATEKATDRNAKITKRMSAEVIAGQREVLELAKKLSADPDHIASVSFAGVTEAAVAAQSRALAFAQLAYQEATGVSSEAREFTEKMTKANQETAEAAIELSRTWAGLNPFAEVFLKGFEASVQAASNGQRAQ